ncbi:MAG TPA: serine hydrolase [Gammaproteobacteria bacterium]|nr:serine hydrolase [Gammaproteobacteria bacterium]
MIKKIVVSLSLLLVAAIIGLNAVGISPAFIYYGPGVASGIGSKLLCSAEYVIGNSREQAFDDLVQYSPILSQVTVRYNDQDQSVTTSLFGLQEKTASYIPGLGCAVDYPSEATRFGLRMQPKEPTDLPWPRGSSVTSIDQGLQTTLGDMLAADNAAGLNTRALLLVHKGEIKAEAYGQAMNAESRLLGWSMAKSLNSIMLGNLEMRGLIDLGSAPGFDAWSDDGRANIVISDMLTMTDGLKFSEQYNPGDDATAMLFTSASTSDYVLDMPLAAVPGSRFNYSSGTANLLARLYTEILGSPQQAYDDYRQHIFAPLGFQHAVFETDASGVFVGSSFLYASARDWARMGQLMLNGGELNGVRIVTQDWVARATQPNSSGNDQAYGYQWWLNRGNERLRFAELPEDMYYASGNRQQLVAVVPSADAVIVRLGWTAGRYPVTENFGAILEAL